MSKKVQVFEISHGGGGGAPAKSKAASIISSLPPSTAFSAQEFIQSKIGMVMTSIEENKDNFLGIDKSIREGATPEIKAALEVCVAEIFDANEVDETTGTMRRDLIR